MSFARSSQFRRLYSSHFRLVWSVVGQLGMRGAAREDAAQEIWIVVVRRLHTLDPDASERAWLCAIARKVVWRLRRNTQRFDARVAAFAETPRPESADASTRYEAATTAAEALATLSEAQRSVLVLTLVHGFTAPEVSGALEIPLNTVYSRLRLARQRIAAFHVQRRELEDALDPRPPDGARQRVLRAVLPFAQVPWIAASTVKAFALGGVLSGVLVTAGGSVLESPPPPTLLRAAVLAPRVPAEPSTSAATPPVEAAVPHRPEVVPAVRAPSRKAPRSAPPTSKTDPGSLAPGPVLDDESRLLARAQRALRTGDPKQALRLLGQHQLQFSDGRLADVRDGARVRALCALGRTQEAAQIRQRLVRERPGSAIATAVEDVCAGDDDGSNPTR